MTQPEKNTSEATSGDQPEVSSATLTRDWDFYYEFITIQMENTLFRVPVHCLERCTVFRDMLDLPNNGSPEGTDDHNPLRLEGVQATEFREFLSVLCNPYGSEVTLSEAQWIIVLELACRWDSESIRNHATSALLQVLASTKKITLGRRFGIKDLTYNGMLALTKRDEPLNLDEAKELALEDVLKISRLREYYCAHMTTFSAWGLGRDYQRQRGWNQDHSLKEYQSNKWQIPQKSREYMTTDLDEAMRTKCRESVTGST